MNFQTRGKSIQMSTSVVTILFLALSTSSAQRLCTSSSSKVQTPSNSSILLEHFSTGKCLRVEAFGLQPNSKVVLSECSYSSKQASKDIQFTIVPNSLNKSLIKMETGGDNYCLTLSKGNTLQNALCDPMSFDQSWTPKPVQGYPGQFIIEQYSSKKCLKPKTLALGSIIQLAPCNAYQTEQIWKFMYRNQSDTKYGPLQPC